MKKFINILACLIVAMCNFANAQTISPIDTWFLLNIQGDELIGTSDDEVLSFITKKGNCVMHNASHLTAFVLIADRGVFDFQTSRYSSLVSEEVIIGFYNDNDELVDKEETYLGKAGKYSAGVLISEKLFDFMSNNSGFVRFRARLYGGTYFDEKIPTWKSMPPVRIK